jgi:hypothetical protein
VPRDVVPAPAGLRSPRAVYPEDDPGLSLTRSFLVFQPFEAYWLLDAPTGLTLKNSTFCPHCVFMCFVGISEQTATFVLYNINRLVGWLVGYHNRDEKCLLRGTHWVFK